MITIAPLPEFKIEFLQLFGCYIGSEAIKHIIAHADHKDQHLITMHVDTVLFSLDSAPDNDTWNELETIWEMLASQKIDYLEIPSNLCCNDPHCVNRKYNPKN